METLKDLLSKHCPDYGHSDIHSILEMLWDCYTLYNPIESAAIQARLQELQPIMDVLTYQQENDLFTAVCGLCAEHERAAFLEGLRVGARLATELAE